MQLTFKKILLTLATTAFLAGGYTAAYAESAEKKTTYTEVEFLNKFSGKSKAALTETLGKPFKTGISVKPSGATTVMLKAGADEKASKPVKVEMWYYKNIVKYDDKHTYKETELTLVNDKVNSIAFFNNR